MAERIVDAAFSDGVSTATFFLTDQCVVFDYVADHVHDDVHPLTAFPVGAASGFSSTFAPPGPSTSLDAAPPGKGPFVDAAYFFRGSDSMRFRTTSAPMVFEPPEARSISLWDLPAAFSTVDAAFNGALNRESFCYFFKDSPYVRYIWARSAVDAGYPKQISNM